MYQLRTVFTLSLSICFIKEAWSQINYCQPNLCRTGRQHIGCNNDGGIGSQCSSSATQIGINAGLQRTILRRHNLLRNRIATGSVNGYQPATRMASMVWNDDLASLAAMNAKRCLVRHDECRNTLVFPFSGQNGGRTAWRGARYRVGPIAVRMINFWFSENRNCNAVQLNNLTVATVEQCGHFSSMIQEKNNAVGCGILRQIRNRRVMQFITCNYAYTNVYTQPVYRTGASASNCTSGTNPQFVGLCSVSETYSLATTQL